MISYDYVSNIKFSGKINSKEDLSGIRKVITKTFPYIDSPSRYSYSDSSSISRECISNMESYLAYMRATLNNIMKLGDNTKYFTELINMVQGFKLANCSEFAEIANMVLKMNNIKSSAIFNVFAKKNNDSDTIRSLDHALAAVNEEKSDNFFEPNSEVKIVDLWMDNFIGTFGDAKKKYEETLGLQFNEKIVFKRVDNAVEPNENTIEILKQKYPSFLV